VGEDVYVDVGVSIGLAEGASVAVYRYVDESVGVKEEVGVYIYVEVSVGLEVDEGVLVYVGVSVGLEDGVSVGVVVEE